jgi:hypothetical protein
MSNDFVLSQGGKKIELLTSDVHDWRITFVDTGLNTNIRQRLLRVRRHLAGEKAFLANYRRFGARTWPERLSRSDKRIFYFADSNDEPAFPRWRRRIDLFRAVLRAPISRSEKLRTLLHFANRSGRKLLFIGEQKGAHEGRPLKLLSTAYFITDSSLGFAAFSFHGHRPRNGFRRPAEL